MKGLILEGGGMRGIYTAGVLDCFHDNDIFFNYIVGVSAGACHACSYITRQRGRNLKIASYIPDKRYMSMRNLVKSGSYFGMDFVFDDIPVKLIPFDYKTFFKSTDNFYIGAIDIETGKTYYFSKNEMDKKFTPVRASMSLPGISRVAEINGHYYLDGGISSPIPLEKSMEDGNEKHIVVLTQPKGFIKQQQKVNRYFKFKYRKYPMLIEAMKDRHNVYNKAVKLAEALEAENKAIIIRPSTDFKISRLEKDMSRIKQQYELGYSDTKKLIHKIKEFIS